MAVSFSGVFVASVEGNPEVRRELAKGAEQMLASPNLAVTEITNPRLAYFRRKRPEISASPDRMRLLKASRAAHDRLARAVSVEEFTERHVVRDGVVGRVDVYEDVPTELKTTNSIPADLQRDRPSYFDQLGVYCALTDEGGGRLIVSQRVGADEEAHVVVLKVAFADVLGISGRITDRRDMLHEALGRSDPQRLPQCEWYPNCEYSGVCGCGALETPEPLVSPHTVRVEEDSALAQELADLLNAESQTTEGHRLNDLVFPRKAFFEREHRDRADDDAGPQRRGNYQRALEGALHFGVAGAFSRVPVRLRSLWDHIGLYRDVPTVIRTNRSWNMVRRDGLADGVPHYLDRLAFECGLLGSDMGRLVIYYERLPDEQFVAYDVRFAEPAALHAEAERRLRLLESQAPAAALPSCPAWMAQYCDFSAACGCAQSQADP